MAMIFTIDAIEGNSYIGVPVFSRSAKKANYNYLVFSSPKNQGQGEEMRGEDNDYQQSKTTLMSPDKLGVMKKIKELEAQTQKIIEAERNQNKQQTSFQQQEGQNQKDQNEEAKNEGKHRKKGSHSVFGGGVTRDKYYKVHGMHREHPKLGGNYNPKFQFVEKQNLQFKHYRRVTGPIYGEKDYISNYDALKALKIKKEQFMKDKLCSKIMKALDDDKDIQPPQRNSRLNSSTMTPAKKGDTMNEYSSMRKNMDLDYVQGSTSRRDNYQGLNSSMTDPNNGPVTPALKNRKKTVFSFKNTKALTNKYHLLQKFPERSIIKDEIGKLPPQVIPRIQTRDFLKTLRRKSFVTERDPPNEKRFDPSDSVMNQSSAVLSKTKKLRDIDIGKACGRDSSLILKGGNLSMDLGNYNNNFYDPKKDFVLSKTTKNILNFEKHQDREYNGGIYRKDFSPDYYDSDKIQRGYTKQSHYTAPKAMFDMGKQQTRDFTKLYTQSEAYNNIKRENERHEYIKKLLQENLK